MRTRFTRAFPWLIAVCGLAACGAGADDPATGAVVTSGKSGMRLEDVPAEVLQAAREARPDLDPASAEYEVRDGREYYDIEGRLPDGAEIELDMTIVNQKWTVVEVQRDLRLEQVAEPVRRQLAAAKPDWTPSRIIESDQGDGLVIYEFFGPGPADDETKVEVKWQDGAAEVLEEEWKH